MHNEASTSLPEWDAAIEKLAIKTEKGELLWEPLNDFHGNGENIAVPPAFIAEVQGRNVLVYEYRYKYFTDAEEWEWQTDIAIEFVDSECRLEYTWQGRFAPRSRLLNAIRYRAAHVNDFLEQFLRS